MQKILMAKIKKTIVRSINTDSSAMLAELIIEGIVEKKGQNIVSLNLQNIGSAVSDYFVICHADSRPQIEAIARSIEEVVYKAIGEDPSHREGFENAEWILLDYFNVVVHIFQTEKREFYGIERLWADAEVKKIAANS
jgi:ribosome-associated protein